MKRKLADQVEILHLNILLVSEGIAMEDYESLYDEYKRSLLQSHFFIEKMKEGHKNALMNEAEYIDRNGVLSKIAILSGICGFCFSAFLFLEDKVNTASIIIRIVLVFSGILCAFRALFISQDYKKSSGNSNFHSFIYDRFIENRVHYDKDFEAKNLMEDMLEKIDLIQWRAELLEEGSISEAEQLQSNLLYVINKSNDFQKRFDRISMYDSFAQDLQDDFYFSKAIHESLK